VYRMKEMFKLIYSCIKAYRRIFKLLRIQSQLLKEMELQLESYEKDKTICISTYLFMATNAISKHIEVIDKQIDESEEKMRRLCKIN